MKWEKGEEHEDGDEGRGKLFTVGKKGSNSKATECDVCFVCHVEGIQSQIKMNLCGMGFGLMNEGIVVS